MKVNTFIVGAPKAGTTSLHHYLSQHPDVCMSSLKEPNYFSSLEVSKLFYNSKIISSTDHYHQLFVEEKKVIGEASVSYLYYPDVPQRIYNYNPQAKIIIMLREPIERGFSHYLMDSRLGYCKESLDDIVNSKSNFPMYFLQYVKLGAYYQQVQRYLTQFGNTQVHMIFYSDFKNNTSDVMSKLFDFLNINDFKINFSIENSFLSPSNAFIKLLYQQNTLRKCFKKILPKQILMSIKNKCFSKSVKPQLNPQLHSQLKAYYKKDIERLELILNTDLSEWKEK